MGDATGKKAADRESHTEEVRIWRQARGILLSRIVSLVAILAIPAFAVQTIGIEGYGVWESINGLNTFGIILQAVVGSTVLWKASVYVGANQIKNLNPLFWLGVSLSVGIAAVAGFVGVFSSGGLQVLLQVPKSWGGEYGLTLSLALAVAPLGAIVHVLFAISASFGKAGIAALAQSLGVLVIALVTGMLLAQWQSIWAFPVGNAVGILVSVSLLLWLVRTQAGVVLWPVEGFAQDEILTVFRYGGILLLSNSTLLVRDAFDKIVVTTVDGPTGAAYMGVALVLTLLLGQIMAVLQSPYCAAVGRAYAVGQHHLVRELYGSFVVRYAVIIGLLVVNLAAARRPLLFFWFGREMLDVEPYLVFTMLGAATAITMTAAGVGLAKACGQPGIETRYLMVTLGLMLCLKPGAIVLFGGIGAVASTCFSIMAGAVVFNVILHRRIVLPWAATQKAMLIYGVTLVLGLAAWKFGGTPRVFTSRVEAVRHLLSIGAVTTLLYGVAMASFFVRRNTHSPLATGGGCDG